MVKPKDKKLSEDFSKLIDKILSGEEVDLAAYPDDFQKEINFARTLIEHKVAPSPSLELKLRQRLLSKLQSQESPTRQGFSAKLRKVWREPAWQAVAATFLLILLVSGIVWGFGIFQPKDTFKTEDVYIKKFASAQEFKDYIQKAADQAKLFGSLFPGARAMELWQQAPPALAAAEPVPERVSETTVQVKSIDEPDIVKTDGRIIYFSPKPLREIQPLSPGAEIFPSPRRILPPPQNVQKEAKTNLIKAFPPQDLNLESKVDKSGDLLLHNNMLLVFSEQEITGYDVSDPKSPAKKWNIKLEDSTSIVATRLYKDKIYLITKTTIDLSAPSSIKLLTVDGTPLNVDYAEIYHPTVTVPVDVTFSVLAIDPYSGETKEKVSFVGSSGSSVVYMSEKAIYVTYSYSENLMKFLPSFLRERAEGFVPGWLIEKVEKLVDYDISDQAKLFEFQNILEKYLNSLEDTDRTRVQEELSRRLADYYSKHKRDLEKTGIIKMDVDGLKILATGKVPGYPVNQFALDEHNGYLRIATTVGERAPFLFGLWAGTQQSANDVYVLDRNLNIRGSIRDLGLTERIYAARFIEDKGYLVTFRQTDPFYVLDLSDPEKPQLRGELKISGYSSYLEPVGKDKVLGIGKEGQQVKVSLFDVSLPENPQELDKYTLDEFWSDVLATHHAFLLDSKHEIFFLPGSKAGYVISYRNDKLKLKMAIEGISARRAIFIDDYLYIIGENKITVLDENSWKKISELNL